MAHSNLDRQKRLRARRVRAGLKEVRNLWVHPDDEAAIREYAEMLARQRRQPSTVV